MARGGSRGTVRVLAGAFRGRVLAYPPPGRLRPTTARVREALFDILGARVAGGVFVDLCCGAGAVGIEALSRGAARAVFVDADRRTLGLLRENLERLGVGPGRAAVHAADAAAFVAGGGLDAEAATVVFADPPYGAGVLDSLLAHFAAVAYHRVGALVVEHRGPLSVPEGAAGLHAARTHRYGETVLTRLAWAPGAGGDPP